MERLSPLPTPSLLHSELIDSNIIRGAAERQYCNYLALHRRVTSESALPTSLFCSQIRGMSELNPEEQSRVLQVRLLSMIKTIKENYYPPTLLEDQAGA